MKRSPQVQACRTLTVPKMKTCYGLQDGLRSKSDNRVAKLKCSEAPVLDGCRLIFNPAAKPTKFHTEIQVNYKCQKSCLLEICRFRRRKAISLRRLKHSDRSNPSVSSQIARQAVRRGSVL